MQSASLTAITDTVVGLLESTTALNTANAATSPGATDTDSLLIFFETSDATANGGTQDAGVFRYQETGTSANDTAAVGAMMQSKKMGISIPHDFAIIGFNDDPLASMVDPALSSVTHPAIKMGEISARRILEHSSDNFDKSISEVSILNTEVVMRDSSRRKG